MVKLLLAMGALALGSLLVCLLPFQLLPDAGTAADLAALFYIRNLTILLPFGYWLVTTFAKRTIDCDFRGFLETLGVVAVLVCMLLLCVPAFAQTAAPAPSGVDLSSLVNQVLEAAVLALGAVVGWVIKRGVVALESLNVLQINSVHGSTIDDAVASAVGYAQSKLEALIDPKLKMTMTNSVLSEAAQLVLTTAPNAVAALGLTPASLAAKIQLALGNPLAAADAAPAAPAAPPASPPVI